MLNLARVETAPFFYGRWLLLVALSVASWLVCGCSDETEPLVVPETFTCSLAASQHRNMTIAALAEVETNYPIEVAIEFSSDGTPLQRTNRASATMQHRIHVVGMREVTDYTLEAVGYYEGEEVCRSEPVVFTTGAIPDHIPDFEVIVHDPERMQPGYTLLSPTASPPRRENILDYVALDWEGYVVWYYTTMSDSTKVNADIFQLPDGNFLVWIFRGFQIVNYWGQVLEEHTTISTGGGFHHEVLLMPNGNFLALVGDSREIDHPLTGERINVAADQIVEINRRGEVVWSWNSFDHLDTGRWPDDLASEPHHNTGIYQLTHSNALVYLEEEDAVLISMRHQHWVLKIDRATGDIIWRLGHEGDFDLINYDEESWATWFFGQHAPYMVEDDVILLYDNGNFRRPEPEEPFTRAVMYRIDEDAMEAEHLWSYELDAFTAFIGETDLLENGNALICNGGPDVHVENPERARIIEVTLDEEAERIWEVILAQNYIAYRAERVSSLYPQ